MEINQFVENFAAQLENDEQVEINETTKFKELEEWDSLIALSIIAMCDEKYSIKLTGDDIKNSLTLADLFEKVRSKTG